MNALQLFKTKMVKKMENKGNENKKMKAVVCTKYGPRNNCGT